MRVKGISGDVCGLRGLVATCVGYGDEWRIVWGKGGTVFIASKKTLMSGGVVFIECSHGVVW